MGLRINTNLASLSGQRQLYGINGRLNTSLERLSTGLRINKASDDPSGMVISEGLKAQIKSIDQAIDNSEFASNVISTAEAALSEISSLLVDIRASVVFALNKGGATYSQIMAEQDKLNQALSAIDRIASSTRFGERNLLDGSSDFAVTIAASDVTFVDNLDVQKVQFANGASQASFTLKVNGVASRAILSTAMNSTDNVVSIQTGMTSGTTDTVTLRVTGSLGTTDISLAEFSTFQDLRTAINNTASRTGVYVSTNYAGTTMSFFSTEFGSNQTISIENVTSDNLNVGLKGTTIGSANTIATMNEYTSDVGADVKASIDGASMVGNGFDISVVSNFLTADFQLSEILSDPNTNYFGAAITSSAPAEIDFTITKSRTSGLTFQLGDSYSAGDRIALGIRSMTTAELGMTSTAENFASTLNSNTSRLDGGFLSSLKSGSTNDLMTNPENALKIVDEALEQVSTTRAFLGSVQRDTIDRNINALSIHMENLTASNSTIADLDFAQETAEFTKLQVQFQATTAVLASANLIPQNVLTLLS